MKNPILRLTVLHLRRFFKYTNFVSVSLIYNRLVSSVGIKSESTAVLNTSIRELGNLSVFKDETHVHQVTEKPNFSTI